MSLADLFVSSPAASVKGRGESHTSHPGVFQPVILLSGNILTPPALLLTVQNR